VNLSVQLITQLKQEVAVLLFKVITVDNKVSKQLIVFRNLYLAGQGDFADIFIEYASRLKHKFDAILVPVSGKDVRQVFKRALIDTGLDKKIEEDIISKLSFEVVTKISNAKFFESSIFGVPIRQNYKLEWPMSIVISPQDISK
jgi:hypothetical protein